MNKEQMLCSIKNLGKGIISLIDEKRQYARFVIDLTEKFPDKQNSRSGEALRLQINMLVKALDSDITKVINYSNFEEMFYILNDDKVLKGYCKGTLQCMLGISDNFKSIVSLVNSDLTTFFGMVQPQMYILNATSKSKNYWQTVKTLKSAINSCMRVFFNNTAIAIKNVNTLVNSCQQQFLKDIQSLVQHDVENKKKCIQSIDEMTDAREELLTYAKQLSNAGQRRDGVLMIKVRNNLNKLNNQLDGIFLNSKKALFELSDPGYLEYIVNSVYDENPRFKDGKMKTQNWAIQATKNKWLYTYKQAIENGIKYLIKITTEQNINPKTLQDSFSTVVAGFRKCKISISGDQIKDPLENMLDDLERGWAGTGKIRFKKQIF
jgi:hypothetical protein